MGFNWECPFCGRHTTITGERLSTGAHQFDLPTKHGDKLAIWSKAIACPNDECKELFVVAALRPYEWTGSRHNYGDALETWKLRPQASVKVFPDYIPEPVLQDYQEACLIRDLSPKASATLSRRCLQGMIRDFWEIRKDKLSQEIDALKDRVDGDTWNAIDGLRQIGNIGAHMEKDINLVLDVDPDEASLLIGLIETLLEDWYIARHDRQERMASIKGAAEKKKQFKAQAKVAALPPATATPKPKE
jgi:hypothetical protein